MHQADRKYWFLLGFTAGVGAYLSWRIKKLSDVNIEFAEAVQNVFELQLQQEVDEKFEEIVEDYDL